MKAKKIYNAPKCKAIEMDTESLLMSSDKYNVPMNARNRTTRFSEEEEGEW